MIPLNYLVVIHATKLRDETVVVHSFSQLLHLILIIEYATFQHGQIIWVEKA